MFRLLEEQVFWMQTCIVILSTWNRGEGYGYDKESQLEQR
jgi:hypothetical protein